VVGWGYWGCFLAAARITSGISLQKFPPIPPPPPQVHRVATVRVKCYTDIIEQSNGIKAREV
jgi:hypothetical protein